MLKRRFNLCLFLAATLFFANFSHAGLREDIINKKAKVFSELSSLSTEVNIEGLQEISERIQQEELDILFFRLTKEIEKVPEFNLGRKNNYDLRLIQALTEIIYFKAGKDYLSATNKLKNLAGQKLFAFPIYTDLLVYQLDSVMLRGNIDITKNDLLLEQRIAHLETLDSYIRANMDSVLSSTDLSKAPVERLSHLVTCASLF